MRGFSLKRLMDKLTILGQRANERMLIQEGQRFLSRHLTFQQVPNRLQLVRLVTPRATFG
ncbi:MAG: hypothetical protein GX575_06475 [Candidatus Anammoximicrobium sp.]|nr:hypothetical protein [Candidatus Anammoximicrobium sp.]